jgi:septum site-determining protein MinD
MIINIVSGKGGTGKTLLCASMAEALGESHVKALIIDMDFAVRGLTSLLYYDRGESYNIIRGKEKLSAYDLFEIEDLNEDFILGIEKYRSFDVLPAVRSIDWKIDHRIENQNSKFLETRIIKLLSRLEKSYDIIFIDSRAGYDELNSVIHNISDLTICVQEEDEISYITALNLIRQFESESSKPVRIIVNKARNVKDIYDTKYKQSNIQKTYGFLGTIPFDIDVMNSFGESDFWEKIKRTLYYAGVIDILRVISDKFNLPNTINYKKIRPIPSLSLEKRLAYLALRERTLLLFGLILSIGGLLISVLGTQYIKELIKYQPERVFGVVFSMVGFGIIIFTLLKKRK